MYNESGRRASGEDLSEIFGITYKPEAAQFGGFDVYMQLEEAHELPISLPMGKLIPTGGIQMNVAPISCQVVASTLGGAAVHYGPLGEETGFPAVLMSQPGGKGRVVYFAPPIGNRYLEFGVPAHRELIASAVRWAAGEEPPVRLENAPRTMALTAFEQNDGGRLVIHLVNSVRDETLKPVEEIIDCYDMRLIISTSRQLTRVVGLRSERDLIWKNNIVEIIVDIPHIHISEIILLEFG
jgi:hypothetical protein